ncbi:MAG: DUF3798 domain-containing protein [Lachnospiraceae bacterium]|nr:DUF3798 domain-containing protein [Lachnospiraceae bacterium]
MKKKLVSLILASAMAVSLMACAGAGTGATIESVDNTTATEETEDKSDGASTEDSTDTADAEGDFHIGIVTGSVSQSEDDRRGAEAFQAMYGEDKVTLAIYPDNFTEELETTIQTIVNLSDDPLMKAIIVNQAIPGTTEAFRQIKERRPDIICIAGEAHEDLPEIGSAADLVVNNDFVARGYLMIRTAHELGCDTFVHISFPRHLSYETMSRRVAIMKEACNEFGMKFEMETAPDPTTDVGVPGAQAYILEHVPEWVEKYGTNSAYFCTNDAHTEPLLKMLLECGGYFIEADLPSPLMGYPGALGIDLTEEAGDFEKILAKVEKAVCEKGGAGRFGTWAFSYGYTVSAGLAEHARNVILGESELTDIDDISKAYGVFSPGAEWNGSNYANADTGVKAENTFLIYQDTYIMGDPGHYMGSTKVEVPEKYFTIK